MKEVVNFLSDLSNNNNREWFETNKLRYKSSLDQFNDFTEDLIKGISIFDSSISGLSVKNCTYRIYRDVRFSPNKLPYKTHMGAYICPKGKKSGYAGYYFHLEPQGLDYIGGSILASGLHCPENSVIRSVRDDIFDHGDDFIAAINMATGFELDLKHSLKKIPKEFINADSRDEKYLKLKEFILMRSIPEEIIERKQLLEYVINEFAKTERFNKMLNRSVLYSLENNT